MLPPLASLFSEEKSVANLFEYLLYEMIHFFHAAFSLSFDSFDKSILNYGYLEFILLRVTQVSLH